MARSSSINGFRPETITPWPPAERQTGGLARCACGSCGAHRYVRVWREGPSGRCPVCQGSELLYVGEPQTPQAAA